MFFKTSVDRVFYCGTALRRALFLFIFLFLGSFASLYGHTVQISYCITDEGRIRVFFEHWHGNLTVAQTANAVVNMTVFDSSTGMTTNFSSLPAGVVWDTGINDLPGCKGGMNVLSQCNGANMYNDWAYWDFTPPECFVDIRISINSVGGTQSWIFVEACGGLMPTSFQDSFEDCAPPVIMCPADVTYEASESDPCGHTASSGLEPTAEDDCTPDNEIVIAYDITGVTTVTGGMGNVNETFLKGTSQVVYSATDNNGTSATCSFNVTVDDTVAPDFTCPSDLTIDCDENDPETQILDWLATATATDACSEPVMTNDYDANSFAASSGMQTVTFAATDECDNRTTCTADIMIVDDTDPVIDCPDDITVECGDPNNDAIISNWLALVSATDNCAEDVNISNNYASLSANECGGVTTVTFIAADGLSNTASCTSTITHDDTTDPILMMKPRDETADCVSADGNPLALRAWLTNNGGGMAMDDCDAALTWTQILISETETCGHTVEYVYEFEVEDNCGNTATSQATFTVMDEAPPTLNLPADATFICNANTDTNINNLLDNATATDVCSDDTEIDVQWMLFSYTPACGGTREEVWQYVATDECDNQTIDYLTITVEDNTVPVLGDLPENLNLQCGDPDNPTLIEEWMESMDDAVSDACGGPVTVTNNWDGFILRGLQCT